MCGNLYRINFESLFIAYENGFDMNTGSSRSQDFLYNMYQFSVDDSKNIKYTSLNSRLLRNWTHVFSTPCKTFAGEHICFLNRLTGNLSMFLDTDGNVAWLYHCQKHLSPIRGSSVPLWAIKVCKSHNTSNIRLIRLRWENHMFRRCRECPPVGHGRSQQLVSTNSGTGTI